MNSVYIYKTLILSTIWSSRNRNTLQVTKKTLSNFNLCSVILHKVIFFMNVSDRCAQTVAIIFVIYKALLLVLPLSLHCSLQCFSLIPYLFVNVEVSIDGLCMVCYECTLSLLVILFFILSPFIFIVHACICQFLPCPFLILL